MINSQKGTKRRVNIKVNRILLHMFLIITSLLMISPFIWAVLTSFKENQDIISATHKILPQVWTLASYVTLPEVAPFFRFFLNSLIICSTSTLFIIIGCPAAGYAFAKYRFKGQNFLFFLIIATMLVPLQIYIIPLYMIIGRFGWINTYQGMIFPTIIMSSGIFFLRQHIMSIPQDLIDSARMDGASEFGIFGKIIFPLSVSATAAVAIINWVFVWSLFMWYLIVANSESLFTMDLGLMYFQRHFVVDYAGIMAATVISFLPVLIIFLIFRTRIVEGIASTGMKY